MGLSLVVGILAELNAQGEDEGVERFRSQFDAINAVLRAKKFPEHHEPAELPADRPPFTAEMVSYRGLHTLRRLAAHLLASGSIPEPANQPGDHKDPILADYYNSNRYTIPTTPEQMSAAHPHPWAFKHLMLHNDAEGYYLPLGFRYVIFPAPESRAKIAGGMIGSSFRLLEECRALANALALPLDTDPESDEVQQAVESPGQGAGWRRYGVESHTCLQFHRAARASIDLKAALVFT